MIFVDTSVFMYAVGKPHPLQSPAQHFFGESLRNRKPLFTSAEVIQELMHVYLRTKRPHTLDSALELMDRAGVDVWPLEEADVILARQLHDRLPALSARDLCHFACCRRRGVREIMTFDQALAAAGAKLAGNAG
ncbi:MAG: type II toxin-antitoxin system VapC family toxin [Chloroflexi bacterium]|nr:type II toxin-antitoxin system VapC family toxin [Chloroflexota bacterium]